MKKLLIQFIKFGVVGVICFVIDWLFGLVFMNIIMAFNATTDFEKASVISSAIGFTISVIANYYLSFRFVFRRRQNLNKRTEFIIFVFLSVIGLVINGLIIWLCTGPVYKSCEFLYENVGYNLMYTGAKILATAIVMVYNFISRKIFLEQKTETPSKQEAIDINHIEEKNL